MYYMEVCSLFVLYFYSVYFPMNFFPHIPHMTAETVELCQFSLNLGNCFLGG